MRLIFPVPVILGLAMLSATSVVRAATWTQDVYVWQRESSPAVAKALDAERPLASGFYLLGAEVAWTNGQPQVFRPVLDYAHLAKLDRPIGLVLRVGAFGGPFVADDAAAKALAGIASSLLADTRAAGLTPSELQIDFDCAESKLDGYRVWLGALRKVTGKTPLVFTALPVWLAHDKEFAALSHAADGFVLQVHSVERPTAPDAPFTLCDPARALAWAAQAARVGVPFRIALPTYGYKVAFDAAGKFFALAAEGPQPSWPADTQVRIVRADAIAMAHLEQSLQKTPPPNCTGVIWFRLPVEGDQLNWDMVTFNLVLQGKTPAAKLAIVVEWPEPGLAEISVVNTGTTTEPWPKKVALRWPVDAPPQATDGLAGFHLETENAPGQGTILNASPPPESLLAPGHRVKIAWLRFSHEISIDASFSPVPP